MNASSRVSSVCLFRFPLLSVKPADKDIFNMVRVHTARDGEWVDDADDIDLNTRRFLRQELERINEYRNFGIL